MRKFIAIFTILCFLVVTMPLPAGEESSEGSGEESGEELAAALALAMLASVAVLVGLGMTTTALVKKKKRNNAAVLFNEATGSHGERPNLEIMARLYEISVDEVIDKITDMAVRGDIDIEEALMNTDSAELTLVRLSRELETYAREKKGRSLALLQKFKEKAKDNYRNIMQAAFPSLEMAELYRSLQQEENR